MKKYKLRPIGFIWNKINLQDGNFEEIEAESLEEARKKLLFPDFVIEFIAESGDNEPDFFHIVIENYKVVDDDAKEEKSDVI